MVGQRGKQEVIRPLHVPFQAARLRQLQVRLQHPADEVLSELRGVEVVEQLPHRPDQ